MLSQSKKNVVRQKLGIPKTKEIFIKKKWHAQEHPELDLQRTPEVPRCHLFGQVCQEGEGNPRTKCTQQGHCPFIFRRQSYFVLVVCIICETSVSTPTLVLPKEAHLNLLRAPAADHIVSIQVVMVQTRGSRCAWCDLYAIEGRCDTRIGKTWLGHLV